VRCGRDKAFWKKLNPERIANKISTRTEEIENYFGTASRMDITMLAIVWSGKTGLIKPSLGK
jgi:hypothetical protein